MPSDNTKKEFDKKHVLDRFDHQLKTSGVSNHNDMSIDLFIATHYTKRKNRCLTPSLIIANPKLNEASISTPFSVIGSPHLARLDIKA